MLSRRPCNSQHETHGLRILFHFIATVHIRVVKRQSNPNPITPNTQSHRARGKVAARVRHWRRMGTLLQEGGSPPQGKTETRYTIVVLEEDEVCRAESPTGHASVFPVSSFTRAGFWTKLLSAPR